MPQCTSVPVVSIIETILVMFLMIHVVTTEPISPQSSFPPSLSDGAGVDELARARNATRVECAWGTFCTKRGGHVWMLTMQLSSTAVVK
jgi:hypothetical protein